MAKIDVILTHNIVGLGAESDQVKVAAGYARNFLYPKGFAIPLSAGNKRRLEALQRRRAEREAHELNTMTELAKSLGKLLCVLKVKTGDDGKMFGTITNGAIADALKTQFAIELDKRKIHLEKAIRALGEYEVEMRLHPQVPCTLKLRIESTTPAPDLAAVVEAAKDGKDAKTEKGDKPERTERKPARAPRAEKKEKAEKA